MLKFLIICDESLRTSLWLLFFVAVVSLLLYCGSTNAVYHVFVLFSLNLCSSHSKTVTELKVPLSSPKLRNQSTLSKTLGVYLLQKKLLRH